MNTQGHAVDFFTAQTLSLGLTLGSAVKSKQKSTVLNESTGPERQDAEVNSIYADSAQ